MNKRSFFKSLAMLAAGASIAPPGLFIPKFEPVKWKSPRLVPDPAWVKAEYEMYFIEQPAIFDPRIFAGKWEFMLD